MSDAFLGEIRMFPFNFAPTGWAHCDGQILPLFQNTALFSLLGTNFGGDGKSNFALPNLQGCCVVDVGQGPGLSSYDVGESGGDVSVTLIQQQNPIHNHLVNVSDSNADSASPVGNLFAKGNYDNNGVKGVADLYTPTAANVTLSGTEIGPTGGNLPHNNLMPYLTLNFCIALQGYFPPRS
jgi:microcystin-dependent protein